MPDQNQNNQSQNTPVPTSPVPAPTTDDSMPKPSIPALQDNDDESSTDNLGSLDGAEPTVSTLDEPADTSSIMQEVASKINESNNILIALSANPTVDEMSAAIGLALCLDRMGKRATAIYSGATPNALEFLKPEETFETSADTLQDFVIAINKEKADHLRYKLDGDYVKIYITPYKTHIGEEDLEYSYGDFNIDLTLALDIRNGSDLDSALREQGRVMHDATVINITTDEPGKFGEIEWSDKSASSISEMIARLIYGMKQKITIEKDEATAFLTGIISATNRFSKSNTTPETMQIASKLMASGADQQLIAENITADMDNEIFNLTSDTKKSEDDTSLDIDHDEEKEEDLSTTDTPEAPKEKTLDTPTETPETTENAQQPTAEEPQDRAEPANVLEAISQTNENNQEEPDTSALLDDLKATEAMLNGAQATEASNPEGSTPPSDLNDEIKPEKTIAPSEDFVAESLNEGTNKYGQMLADALAEPGVDSATVTPEMSAPAIGENIEPMPITTPSETNAPVNPAMSAAPEVAPVNPEINGVPEINYMPLPGDEVLPPPPVPPIDMNAPVPPAPELPSVPSIPEPTEAPAPEPTPEQEPEPSMPAPSPEAPISPTPDADVAPTAQPVDPSAFKIPGA